MTYDQLRYALAVQRHRNFSRAAESCHITQPSLSVQIAKLEDELAVRLFDRSRSTVEVTDEGETLLRQARLIIDETTRLQELAADLKGEVQGPFRLGIIPTLAPALLPSFLGRFRKGYPKVQLSVSEEPTAMLIRRIDEGSLDAALLSTPSDCPEALVEKLLFYEPFVVFASPRHPILEGKTVTPAQISADEILLLDDAHCLRDQVLQLCRSRQSGGDSRTRQLRIQSGSLHTLIEIIRREKGYTLLPFLSMSFLTRREQASGVRLFEKPVPSRKVSLVYHPARLKRAVLEAIAEQVIEGLPAELRLARDQVRVLSPEVGRFRI